MLIKNVRTETYQNTIKPRTIQKNESNIQTTSKGDISQIQIDNYKTQHHQDPILFEDHNGKINQLLIFLSESYVPYDLIERMYRDYEILFNKMKGTKFTFIIGPYDNKVKQDLENMAKKQKVRS
ncbi:MAG: hypothetical protein N2169_07240 [bacterium]|nr:hypothetical protein [bacterium]